MRIHTTTPCCGAVKPKLAKTDGGEGYKTNTYLLSEWLTGSSVFISCLHSTVELLE